MKSPDNNQLVLGLVGNAACGKDYVASVFARRGFTHVSTSELVRQEIYARGLTPSRQLQAAIANEIRASRGPAYFVEKSLKILCDQQGRPDRVLLSGLYAVAEGEYIANDKAGYIIGVAASADSSEDVSLRYRRIQDRADGPRDDLDYQEFMAAYTRENSGTQPCETNVQRLMQMARFTIINSETTTLPELDSQVQGILRGIAR